MAAHADDTKLARFYCGRRVLVTGHTGLLGRWMVALLSACGAEAVGFARGVADEPGAGVIAFAGDIRNPDAVRKAVAASDASVVLHLSAQSRTRQGQRRLTHETNVLGTVNVLEAVAVSDVAACIVVSSSRDPLTRHTDIDFLDPYNASKFAAEEIALDYRQDALRRAPARGVGIARPAVLIGGEFTADRLVSNVMAALMRGDVPHIRKPDVYRPWQHAVEAAAGILWFAAFLARQPTALSGALNFGMNEPAITVGELVGRLTSLWYDNARTDPVAPAVVDGYWLDYGDAFRELGWAPCWSVDRALAATVEWHRHLAAAPAGGQVTMAQQVERYIDDARSAGVAWAQPSTVLQ